MKIAFSEKPIILTTDNISITDSGAELIFIGRVRDTENGVPIVALDYEYYPVMAENKLEEIARKAMDHFDIQDLDCIHRIGSVPVGEASVKIAIRSRHRKAALLAMDWFINALKKDIPIWKWGIASDGKRFPSKTE